MKQIFYSFAALLLATQLAAATNIITIGISQGSTNTLLTLQDNPVTIEKLQDAAAKVASIDAHQLIMIRVDPQTPSEHLLKVLSILNKSGLGNICIVPRQEDGELNLLNLQMAPARRTNEE